MWSILFSISFLFVFFKMRLLKATHLLTDIHHSILACLNLMPTCSSLLADDANIWQTGRSSNSWFPANYMKYTEFNFWLPALSWFCLVLKGKNKDETTCWNIRIGGYNSFCICSFNIVLLERKIILIHVYLRKLKPTHFPSISQAFFGIFSWIYTTYLLWHSISSSFSHLPDLYCLKPR